MLDDGHSEPITMIAIPSRLLSSACCGLEHITDNSNSIRIVKSLIGQGDAEHGGQGILQGRHRGWKAREEGVLGLSGRFFERGPDIVAMG